MLSFVVWTEREKVSVASQGLILFGSQMFQFMLKFRIFPFFMHFYFVNCAALFTEWAQTPALTPCEKKYISTVVSICIHWEIHCLPYAGLFVYFYIQEDNLPVQNLILMNYFGIYQQPLSMSITWYRTCWKYVWLKQLSPTYLLPHLLWSRSC